MNLSTLLLILVVFFLVTPMIQRFATNYQRVRAIRRLEQQRGSRVVTLIHRQESTSLLGLPVSRYIDVDDSTRRRQSSTSSSTNRSRRSTTRP